MEKFNFFENVVGIYGENLEDAISKNMDYILDNILDMRQAKCYLDVIKFEIDEKPEVTRNNQSFYRINIVFKSKIGDKKEFIKSFDIIKK